MTRYPISVGIIGLGKWAGVLATAASKSKKIKVVSAFSRSPEKREAYTREFGIPAVSDLEQILEDKDIQGVLITVPNELHLPIAEQAAAAGKHIYTEKPIANTLADGLKLAALGKRYGLQIVVGHCARLLTGVRLIKEAIDRDELGRVCYIETNYSNDRALDLTPENWRWYKDRSPGGCLSQIAIHQFDVLHYLGGEILELGSMASKLSPAGAEVDDQSMTTVRFADGKLGFVGSSWTSPGIFAIKVVGTKALMHYQIDQGAWGNPDRLHENAVLYQQKRSESFAQRSFLPVPQGNMFCEELDMFADAIMGNTPATLSGENGCVALAMVYAALQSIEEHGRYVDIRRLLAAA